MLSLIIAAATIGAVQQQAPTFDESVKAQTIASLLSALKESYVFPDLADQASDKVTELQKEGAYKDISAPEAFAARLSKDINDVLHDAHFRLRYSEKPLPEREDAKEPSQAEIDAMKQQIKRLNAGIERVERLPGNIGYMEVRSFLAGEEISRPAQAAFEFLKNTDALILDLRRNGGGDPEAVRILCSYFFSEKPVLINSIYMRPTKETTDFWTLKELPGPRYVGKPVYVLAGPRTGSGAEECAYDLQTQKRATVVGEKTWGGANPGGTVRLNDHFSVFVPMGRAINPVTKTNWEGTGVLPDVACPADQSLTRAQELALEELMKSADPDWATALKARLDELKRTSELNDVLSILRTVSSAA